MFGFVPVILVFFFSMPSWAETSRNPIVQVASLRGEGIAEIHITFSRAEPFASWASIESGWGTGVDPIDSMVVLIDSEIAYLPVSAYIGISDPWEIQITQRGGLVIFTFEGGDAGGSYIATFKFDRRFRRIVERTIRHGEFPDEAFEKTSYSYVPDDGR